MDRYAVIGSPIEHSLSPKIHSLFAEQTQQDIEYTAIEVKPEHFFHQVNKLVEEGYKGLNVTVPLKQLAWEMADNCDEIANRAKAVNTIQIEDDGQRCGFNTDGIGLVNDLRNKKIDINGRDLLIVGAGGAVRGVLAPLLKENPASVTLTNRTLEKAESLANEFIDLGKMYCLGFDQLEDHHYNLIINGTSTGLQGTVPPLPSDVIANDCVVYDMMYGVKPTPFVVWAKDNSAKTAIDGLGMLIEQAAEAFSIWRDVIPDTAPILKSIRDEIN